MTAPLSSLLPDFPWDTIADARARATAHPGGLCDLSVGTPVDPVPAIATEAKGTVANSATESHQPTARTMPPATPIAAHVRRNAVVTLPISGLPPAAPAPISGRATRRPPASTR